MPPRYGKLDLAAWAKSAPAINGYKTEPWILKGARIFTMNMEIDDLAADNLLPATMHPSIPAYAIFCVINYPDSPVGPFSIAEVRVSGRTGVIRAASCCAVSATMKMPAASWLHDGVIQRSRAR